MICPFCSHDNIAGVDQCAECGQSLIRMVDIGCELSESITRHEINVLNPRTPVTVAPGESLRNAIRRMVESRIGCLLVIQDETPIGILTERDILNKLADDLTNFDQPVVDFMTTNIDSIGMQDSIAYALHAMDLGGYRHMPIVDETGRPAGMISVRDILRFLCARFATSTAID